MIFTADTRRESVILFFLLLLLGSNALVNAAVGFSLPLFIATVPFAAVLAFFFPRAGFVAAILLTIFFERFFALQPFFIGDIPYKLYPLDIILGAVFLSALLLWMREGKTFLTVRHVDSLLLGFFLLVTGIFLATVFWLNDTSLATAFSTWKNYVFYGLAVFFVGGMIRTWDDLIAFAKLFFIGVLSTLVFLAIGIFRGEGLWTEYTPLSTAGTRFLAFPHAFYFSLALLLLLFSLPRWADGSKNMLRNWGIGVGALLGIGIVSSLMRHLWLGIGGAVLLLLLVSPRVFGTVLLRYMGYGVIVVLFLISGIWFALSVSPASEMAHSVRQAVVVMSERLGSIGDEYDESFMWRRQVWESSLSSFSAHPLFGIGFGARVPVEIGEYQQYVEVRNMHNSWLALLVQTGIVGVVSLLWFIFALVFALVRKTVTDGLLWQARFVVCGLLCFQGLVFFSQPYLETNLLGLFFWITLGVARALLELSEPSKQQEMIV